ncbi:hypothetical protein KDA_21730 [Dictyobacter alpinus]|uniref:Mannosylglycerate hydrolase MGH1-like glycoside hydrolase domain-containing protein n=1 Tax=Dictyobacter alpinus TaxID=2014873 RepID=A0A402B5S4_9CHLR|nr:hypothetical protein [Dictyobacter alpinus]GCE26689.1 hypothetical protein KDA_21730 [Dictyobacter alpinus]
MVHSAQQRQPFAGVTIQRWPWSIERDHDLENPYVTAGNRVYSVATQNGEFPEIGWRQPNEMSGVWDHPIKLLDGFWFGVSYGSATLIDPTRKIHWLTSASHWRMTPGEVEITYQLPGLDIIRQEYGIDDHEGLLVRLRLVNSGQKALDLQLHFLAHTDLRAAWLGENRLIWRDGKDEALYLDEQACIAAYNTINPAYVFFGADKRPATVAIGNDLSIMKQEPGQGTSAHLSYTLHLPLAGSEEMRYIIAGSTHSSNDARTTFTQLKNSFEELARQQQHRYKSIIERCALHSNDELIETAFGWAKLNLQMLERVVPAIGQGISGGLPDFPWWFGKDTTFTALALVASGQFELALSSLRNLAHHSQIVNNNGSVVHEILTLGRIHDSGHLVEVPLFVRACYHVFQWTGDQQFLRDIYDFCVRGLMQHVLGSTDLDDGLCATGKGMIESRELQSGKGFKTLDIAAYTYQALLYLAELAAAIGDNERVPELRDHARRIREVVNNDWWLPEENLFGDIYAHAQDITTAHASLRTEGPLWPGDLKELENTAALLERFTAQHGSDESILQQARPWLLKHMIAAIPMETGLASKEHAAQALARLESDEFTGPWGLYLNPERQAVTMTLPNGIMAAAEAQYQRMDQALTYSHHIARTLDQRMPGAFSEISPDGGCFIQGWSSYGIIWPVVHAFFGFQPNVAQQHVRFIPHFPTSWHTARLHSMRVGSTSMDLEVTKSSQGARIVLETQDLSYEVTLGYSWLGTTVPDRVTLNGEDVTFHTEVFHQGREDDETTQGCTLQIPTTRGLQRYELHLVW